jgi:hypothetical protein
MKKGEIVKAIRDYVNNDKANYAVLINGVWGSGKTYLYEHELKKEILKTENGKSNRKANIYISLYGITSVEQLSKELLISFLMEVKLRGDKNKKKLYKQMNRAMGIFSKTFSFSINGLSIDIDKGIEEIKNNIQFKDMIISFDDFERCNIPVNELFGVINNLVEHCNCKVIILADEDNIGKMYANTNVEAKYLTLLSGRSLKVNENQTAQGNKEGANAITIKELKEFNEEMYSENYIYRDIKEKVIGLSLRYTPILKDEFETIISDTVNLPKLSEKLFQKKEEILECMDKCDNSNIRIMKIWLINFERIYKVIEKNFTDALYERYFDEIFDRFAVYSIRVACALGKNKPLKDWEDDVEIMRVRLDDTVFMGCQGYRFIDDLFKDSVIEDKRVCHAAKAIIKELQDDEEYEKDSSKKQAYIKLNQWYYLEDEEVSQNLSRLKTEIENDEYKPQDYQDIITVLVVLKQKGFIEEDFIKEIASILKHKLDNMKNEIKVENFSRDFADKDSASLFHKFYNPLYDFMIEKNREKDKQELKQMLDCSSGSQIYSYCCESSDKFLQKRSFINYIDLDKLIDIVQTGSIIEIYDIARAFEKVYGFRNLYEFYAADTERLKMLIDRLEQLECRGKTQKEAINVLLNTLKKKVSIIENKGLNYTS